MEVLRQFVFQTAEPILGAHIHPLIINVLLMVVGQAGVLVLLLAAVVLKQGPAPILHQREQAPIVAVFLLSLVIPKFVLLMVFVDQLLARPFTLRLPLIFV